MADTDRFMHYTLRRLLATTRRRKKGKEMEGQKGRSEEGKLESWFLWLWLNKADEEMRERERERETEERMNNGNVWQCLQQPAWEISEDKITTFRVWSPDLRNAKQTSKAASVHRQLAELQSTYIKSRSKSLEHSPSSSKCGWGGPTWGSTRPAIGSSTPGKSTESPSVLVGMPTSMQTNRGIPEFQYRVLGRSLNSILLYQLICETVALWTQHRARHDIILVRTEHWIQQRTNMEKSIYVISFQLSFLPQE